MAENEWEKAYALQKASIMRQRYKLYGTSEMQACRDNVMSDFERLYEAGPGFENLRDSCRQRAFAAFDADSFEAALLEMLNRIDNGSETT